MISKTGRVILLISFLHFACSFPSALVDTNKCKSRNGKFPKLGSLCRSYYSCDNWTPKEKVCPEDQHFFPAKGYCVWPEEYPCSEKPKTKECPLPKGKFLKPGTECKAYYDCCNGLPKEKKCGKGLLFDQDREKCDWPQYVTCPDVPKSKECPLPKGKFLKPGTNCKEYYDCYNGMPTEKKCGKGQLFDQARGKCDWPEYVTCPDEPKYKECPLPKGKFLKPGTGCKVYYDCYNGLPTEKKCEKGQLFDQDKGKCDLPEYVTCPDDKNSKECMRPNGKFLRPRTKCKIYYDCRSGVATEKRCPNDLLFDPVGERCEWPEIYTCVEDVSTTESTSQSPFTLRITSTLVSISTKDVTSKIIPTKIVTTDSDEDSSSKEGSSSEEDSSEENSTQDNKYSSTKSEIESTSPIFTITSDEYTGSTEGELTDSSTESLSTVENSSSVFSSTAVPDDTVSETFTASSTDEYSTKTFTYPEEVTHTEVVTEETFSEVVTEETHPDEITTQTRTEVVTEETHPEERTSQTHTEVVTAETFSEVVTEETHPEEITTAINPKVESTVENKDDYSTIVTSGFTDSVTAHIFCPKPNGYFPHPYNRHKFISCSRGNPIVMDCPENLVYDHKKRSCEYDI